MKEVNFTMKRSGSTFGAWWMDSSRGAWWSVYFKEDYDHPLWIVGRDCFLPKPSTGNYHKANESFEL